MLPSTVIFCAVIISMFMIRHFTPYVCRPLEFEDMNALHQLRCGGVLEAVRISCAGFPTKMPFEDFVDHFWCLVPELLAQPDITDKALSQAIVKRAGLQGYQAGHTKVGFFPGGKQALLPLQACLHWLLMSYQMPPLVVPIMSSPV